MAQYVDFYASSTKLNTGLIADVEVVRFSRYPSVKNKAPGAAPGSDTQFADGTDDYVGGEMRFGVRIAKPESPSLEAPSMLADLLTAVVGADEMRVRCDSATARYTLALAAGVGLTDPTPPGDLTPWVTVTIVVIPGNAKGEWTDTTGGTAIGVL